MVSAHSGSSTTCQSSACKQDNLKSKTFSIIVYILNSTKIVKVNLMGETVEDRVKKALEQVRPQLQADGGDIELLEVENGVAKVKLKGAYSGHLLIY